MINANEARLNITWNRQNGDLADPIPLDAAEGDIRQWVTEAVRAGSIPGIPADATADFRDFVIDRFPPTDARPHNLIAIRPKTAFGA